MNLQKLKETEGRCELLIAQTRRARIAGKANPAQAAATGGNLNRSMHRIRMKVLEDEASNSASRSLLEAESLDDRFRKLEREDQIESLLSELKSRPKGLIE